MIAKELGQVNGAGACQCPRESLIFDCLFLLKLPLVLMHFRKNLHICSSKTVPKDPM